MARPSNTLKRQAEIRRALLSVMAEHGYAGASVADIARAAGLTPGLLHYHFRSKQEILLSLLDRLQAQHESDLDAALAQAGSEPERLLAALLERHLDVGHRNPDALASWTVVSAEALRDADVAAAVRRTIEGTRSRLAQVIADGVARGSFGCDDQPAVVAALLALIQGYFVLAATAPEFVPAGSAARMARSSAAALLHAPAIAQEIA